MTSRAEAIADAIRAAMTTPQMASVPSARVFRDLEGALQCSDLPAVAIETGGEPPPARLVVGHKDRQVEIDVTVIAKQGYASADAAVVEAHARLMADPSLGSLVFELDEGATRRQRQDGEQRLVAVTKTYRARYRTTEDSLQ